MGLTATAYRRDGLSALIFMHRGPKRHVIPLIDATDPAPMTRTVHVHHTALVLPEEVDTTKPGAAISVAFKALASDETRNQQVCDDVCDAWPATATASC